MNAQAMARFREAYESCYSPVFCAILAKTGSYEDSEDLAQEVFMRFYQKIDEVETPRAWIYGAMRNVLMDHFKKRRDPGEDIEQFLDDVSLGYVNGFREGRMVIMDTLKDGSLYGSDLDKSLFDLVSFHGFTVAEAARHCGVSYMQARYSFSQTGKAVIDALKKKGISKLEDLL